MLFVSPSVVLCVFLVCFGVAPDWLVSSWQRPPPSCVVQVLFFPALRYLPSGDPEPPLWTPLELHAPTSPARAAFSSPVLCCLPWGLLPPAAAGLRSLSPFSSLFTLRLSWPATQSLSGRFLLFLFPVVCFLLLFGLFSCCVGVFCCSTCCQPTEVTKDCRVLPAPSVNTHLATVTSSLPARIFWRLACP